MNYNGFIEKYLLIVNNYGDKHLTVADYFLSVRKVEKENYLAYLYLDAKGRLFLMSENADSALMQVVDVNERPDLVEAFSGLIARKISGATSAPVDFILGAENDTPMRNVSLVKDAVREVYGRWCGGVSKEKSVSSEEVKEEFPLSITFTSLQAGEPESIGAVAEVLSGKRD